jgi:hypothetical protein
MSIWPCNRRSSQAVIPAECEHLRQVGTARCSVVSWRWWSPRLPSLTAEAVEVAGVTAVVEDMAAVAVTAMGTEAPVLEAPTTTDPTPSTQTTPPTSPGWTTGPTNSTPTILRTGHRDGGPVRTTAHAVGLGTHQTRAAMMGRTFRMRRRCRQRAGVGVGRSSCVRAPWCPPATRLPPVFIPVRVRPRFRLRRLSE